MIYIEKLTFHSIQIFIRAVKGTYHDPNEFHLKNNGLLHEIVFMLRQDFDMILINFESQKS